MNLEPEQILGEVLKAEKALKERVGIGMSVPERALVNELKDRGIEEVCVYERERERQCVSIYTHRLYTHIYT